MSKVLELLDTLTDGDPSSVKVMEDIHTLLSNMHHLIYDMRFKLQVIEIYQCDSEDAIIYLLDQGVAYRVLQRKYSHER
jgi:hypothetical protein